MLRVFDDRGQGGEFARLVHLFAELLPVPRLHARIPEGHDRRHLRPEGQHVVLDSVADVALGHLSAVVEYPGGFLDRRSQPGKRREGGPGGGVLYPQ